MTTRSLYTLALLCLVLGCDSDPQSSTFGRDLQYAFAPAGNITLVADTHHIRPNGRLLLTVRGTARASGSGRIVLGTSSQEDGGMVIVESPTSDTIRNAIAPARDTVPRTSVLPFSFVANQEFVVPWQLRITNIEHHLFRATAFMDSVFIADSGRSYAVESDIARAYMNVSKGGVFDKSANAIELAIKP